MFLRFLIAEGQCAVGLDAAIPALAHWRLASLPRYLPPEDVERLIASCDRASAVGRRDRAILLLLARVGLRAGDIVRVRLSDVDWKTASIQVCGKGRRHTRLPLTREVGQAIVAYLKKGGRGPMPIRCLSVAGRRFAPSKVLLPFPISSTRPCAALVWCAPVEAPRICCDIRWQRLCCGKVRRSKTSVLSYATAPQRQRRFTPKWISPLCGKLHNPGRRCSYVDPSCRELFGRPPGGWFRIEPQGSYLKSFAAFSGARKQHYVSTDIAIEWAGLAPSAPQRARRLGIVIRFARYLCTENVRHEVPPAVFGRDRRQRPTPYILTEKQIQQVVIAASRSRYRSCGPTYGTLFSLLSCTGLRVSKRSTCDWTTSRQMDY